MPLYLPAGEGEHLYLHVEKRGLSTPELARRLIERYGLVEAELGYAGRKDARGVTTQWLSVPARKVEPELAAIEELGEVRLLEAQRHHNKLRLGHLLANRFSVHLEGEVEVDLLRARATTLAALGVPSYFGAQRFGAMGDSVRQAERFLARRFRPRSRKDRFLVSVAQSAWFNAWLDERVRDGLWRVAIEGDVLLKRTGAPFLCTDPTVDTPRVEEGEVSAGGPLFGPKMRTAGGESMTRESRLLASFGVTLEDLMRHPAMDAGARRASRFFPADVAITEGAGGAEVAFTLARGSYATVFLRELCGPRLADAAFVDGEDDTPIQRR